MLRCAACGGRLHHEHGGGLPDDTLHGNHPDHRDQGGNRDESGHRDHAAHALGKSPERVIELARFACTDLDRLATSVEHTGRPAGSDG